MKVLLNSLCNRVYCHAVLFFKAIQILATVLYDNNSLQHRCQILNRNAYKFARKNVQSLCCHNSPGLEQKKGSKVTSPPPSRNLTLVSEHKACATSRRNNVDTFLCHQWCKWRFNLNLAATPFFERIRHGIHIMDVQLDGETFSVNLNIHTEFFQLVHNLCSLHCTCTFPKNATVCLWERIIDQESFFNETRLLVSDPLSERSHLSSFFPTIALWYW